MNYLPSLWLGKRWMQWIVLLFLLSQQPIGFFTALSGEKSPFFHRREHLHHCPRGSESRRFARQKHYFSASYASVLEVCSRTSHCFSQRAISFLYSEYIFCWDYQACQRFYHSLLHSAAYLHPPDYFNRRPSPRIFTLSFPCYSINRSVGYCNVYLAVSCGARDFIGYFNICAINTGFRFCS